MSKGKSIYQHVCGESQPEKAVADLKPQELRELLGYLGRKGEINGVPGAIWGLCLVEATNRYVEKKS